MATPTQISRPGAHPVGVAAAFLGMFIIGSLAVQLVGSMSRARVPSAPVAPVLPHEAALWQSLGER